MQAIQISQAEAEAGEQQKPMCNNVWQDDRGGGGQKRTRRGWQEGNGGTLTTTTRFATEIDPVAATANASHCSKGFIIMQHAALHGNTVKGEGRGHNSCAKKPKPMAKKKKEKKMHLVSDRARLATSKCDLTKWVNMPPKTGQRLFDVCGQTVGRGRGRGLNAQHTSA